MEAPDSARENGVPVHELSGVNRLSLMCNISTQVIAAITFPTFSLIYDDTLSFMNADHSWDLIWYFVIAVIDSFVVTYIGFSGFVVGPSGVTQRGTSKEQRHVNFQEVLLCLSLLAAIALFIHLVGARVIDWIKRQLSGRR